MLCAVVAIVLGAASPPPKVILLQNMAFGPAPAGLRVGDQVTFRNRDIFQHSATSRDASFDLDLRPKGEATVRLSKAGTVRVYCRYHPGMTLTLKVTPSPRRALP